MADAAVTFLLENVQRLLGDQINLISGAESEMKKLESELKLMKAFLEDSAYKRDKGQLFRIFEQQIRVSMYEAEDTLDTCILSKSKTRFRNILNPNRLSLAKKVKALTESIKPVLDRASTIFTTLPSADVSDAVKPQDDKNRKIPFLRENDVVGLKNEADTVISYLKQDSEELEVISIIGMLGLGKTTLAWKIYHDSRMKKFLRIWVYVSQEFNRRDVFLTILKHFTAQDFSDKSDHELVTEVQSRLRTKKFVLFMDDVWTAENWGEIEDALPKNNKSGKVLITSRDENVAWKANRRREPHRLRFLDSQESWELLQLEIFRKVGKCPSELEVLGKCIARQCGGVPLAIVVIGGVLIEKYSTVGGVGGVGGDGLMSKEWEKVSESVSTYLNNDKLINKLIGSSYNKLPYDLRDCFLYLGMFPEDTEISAWRLTRLWIAEGFIQQNPLKSLEEVAEDNLKVLIIRNLVMVEKTKAEGQVKTCRVHGMIREFCKNESALAKQNLFQEVKKSKEGAFDPRVAEIHKHRRLCIHSYVVEFLCKKPKGPRVRSFLCFSKDAFTLPLKDITSFSNDFDLIRVIDVNPIKFTRFPTKLTQLIHLRYIALSCDEFKFFSEVISKLWNLQTIRIDTMKSTFEIKVDIWKMKELRHFKTKAAIILNKDVKGKAGENLQTLSRLSAECCTEEVFERASNLKNVGIRGELSILLESRCLEKLNHLQKLKLVHEVFPHPAHENPLYCLPQPGRFPPNLRSLTLSTTFLDWKHTSTLGMLGTLEVLKLKENAFMGKIWKVASGGFQSLEFLHIGRTNLEFWSTTSGDHPFPRLQCLVLRNCEKLEEIPHVLVKSLKMMDIERVTKSAIASARKIEQEKQRMQHSAQRGGGFKLIIAPGYDR